MISSFFLSVGPAVRAPLLAQQTAASVDARLGDWISSNYRWLQRQVTPNATVPDPDPSRRGLVISYGIPPEIFPQGFPRSAICDNALAALAFMVLHDRDGAALHSPRALSFGPVEVLKQPQYVPMPVEDQIMIIFVAENGYLDDLPVDRIKDFETGFYPFVREKFPQISKEIRETKQLSDEMSTLLHQAVQDYKKNFVTT